MIKMAEKIKALLIFEILGKPAEHIKITLEQLIDRLGENKGVKITERKVHEPHQVEQEGEDDAYKIEGLFCTFAEVEIEVDELNLLLAIVFNMLPSSVQVIEPAEFRMKNFDLSSFLSELVVRMHKYDEISKTMLIERECLMKEVKELRKTQGKISFSQCGVDVSSGDKENK